MLRDLILQFLFEFLKALLTDELSLRVRQKLAAWLEERQCRAGALRVVHRRVRQRLINRLRTGKEEDT